jgi:hypothetical protein
MHDTPMTRLFRRGPRLRGAHEQFERAQWFLQLSKDSADIAARFRLSLAGLYFARAIIEILLEAAEHQELAAYRNADPKQSRKELEDSVIPDLQHYELVEKIRIHDFHRFGCLPPNPSIHSVFLGGPVKLIARKGAAAVQVTESGPSTVVSGQSQVKQQRPLSQDDGRFFDDASGQYLQPEVILERFLAGVPSVVSRIEIGSAELA